MRSSRRIIGACIFFLLVAGVERAIGTPLFSLVFAAIGISFFSIRRQHQKLVMLALLSIFLAVVWSVPFAIMFGCVFLVNMALEFQKELIIHHSTRFFLATVGSGIVIVSLDHVQLLSWLMVAFVIEAALLFFFIRYWLYQRKGARTR